MDCLLHTAPLTDQTLEQVGNVALELGYDGIDLLVREGAHITPATSYDELPPAVERLRAMGLSVPLVTADFTDDVDPYSADIMAACDRANVRLLRLGNWPYEWPGFRFQVDVARKDLDGIQALSEKYRVRALVQTQSGVLLNANALAVYQMVSDCDPRRVGIFFEPCQMATDRADYVMALDTVRAYLCSVGVSNLGWFHETDTVADEPHWSTRPLSLTEGIVCWPSLMKGLAKLNYAGPLSFQNAHDRTDLDAWKQQAKTDLDFLKSLIGLDDEAVPVAPATLDATAEPAEASA